MGILALGLFTVGSAAAPRAEGQTAVAAAALVATDAWRDGPGGAV